MKNLNKIQEFLFHEETSSHSTFLLYPSIHPWIPKPSSFSYCHLYPQMILTDNSIFSFMKLISFPKWNSMDLVTLMRREPFLFTNMLFSYKCRCIIRYPVCELSGNNSLKIILSTVLNDNYPILSSRLMEP